MFGLFNKKKDIPSASAAGIVAPVHIESAPMAKINLRKETLRVSLEKKGMQNTVARVAVVIDKSGSMRSLYQNGTVQETLERLLPIALKLDDNQMLDVWAFSDVFKRMKSVTTPDFVDYTSKVLERDYPYWGTTKYAPVMRDVVRAYTVEEPSNVPTFVIFLTDGENDSDDKASARNMIVDSAKHNIFWQFVGIGSDDFRFLRALDDLEGRVIDNADFFQINDLARVTDSELYDRLLNEYPGWEAKAKQIGIIK